MNQSAALRTDLYELTMLQGYWAHGRAEDWASFEITFRSVPEGGGYCVAAGIEDALALCLETRFEPDQLEYLATLGLFRPEFLAYLGKLRFTGEVRAVAEGTVVFPHEPLLEVTAPLLEAQWFETQLLNCVNFQTLIATKGSRIVEAARPARVVDFGLRRAQGPNGGLWVARAAYLAGAAGTSNVEAGRAYGIPVYGTHAHSWVMSFATEEEAFAAYAETYPDDAVLLIDTYETLTRGLPAAIRVAKRLEARGHRLAGIRLDSGDLAYLSKACRAALDENGLDYVKILASSDLDEFVVENLKAQGAAIDTFGIGTRLATAYGEPALGGVYKLVALRTGESWQPKIKLSSNPAKTTMPGRKQIWRWESGGRYLGDALATLDESAPERMRHPDLDYKRTRLPPRELKPLLEPRIVAGQATGARRTLAEGRQRAAAELAALPAEHKRLVNPHTYRVGLSDALSQLRRAMIEREG